MPNTKPTHPAQRQCCRHKHIQLKPSITASSPHPGMCGTATRAAGQCATMCASHITGRIPAPISHKNGASICRGMKPTASKPNGIIQTAISGTATMLATTKNGWITPKCAMATGKVAQPASTLVNAKTAPCHASQCPNPVVLARQRVSFGCNTSYPATSAITAAMDI